MWLDNASDIDILFYGPYAKLISDIAKDKTNNPLTIGVFGLWGAGKSTLLNLIDQELDGQEKIICVNINAWMFEGYEDAKTALMETLLKELYEAEPFQKVKETIKKLFKRIDLFKLATSALSVGASVFASVASGSPLPIFMGVPRNAEEAAKAIKAGVEKVQDGKDDYIKDETKGETTVDNIRNFRKDFEQMLTSAEVENVVVIVDDLDRCTPERIIDTLEAIKLFLSVNRTTFIIAADDDVIQYAIKKKYPNIDGSNVELSTEYIEKIIQLPIYIPELSSKDIENYLLLLVAQKHLSFGDFQKLIKRVYDEKYIVRDTHIDLSEIKAMVSELSLSYTPSEGEFMEDALIIDSVRDIVSTNLKGNPRQAKRFLNTFVTKRTLAQMYYGNDIDMRILAKLLVLQKLDSDLFNQLNEWNKGFTICNDEFKAMTEAVLSDASGVEYTKWAIPTIRKWLESEPKDLHTQRLDKYFYLTRENLAQNIIDPQNFSSEARQILEKLGQATRGTINGIMNKMQELSPVDIGDIFSVILPRIENGQLEYIVIKELYVVFAPYQEKILEAINKSKQIATLPDTVYLTAMYKETPEKVLPVLDNMKGGRLSKQLYDRIIGKKV